MIDSLQFPINEPTRVGAARREAAVLAERMGFREPDIGRLNIVVTEVANNVMKHATGGYLYVRVLLPEGINGIEVLSVDKGPGMADVAKCMVDGYSTAGSPGTGLGAVSRLSNLFDIYSAPGQGTIVLARLWAASPVAENKSPAVGCLCVPAMELDECGDAWAIHIDTQVVRILVADGLGHGALAARAANEAVRVFLQEPARSSVDVIQVMHGALRSTRGASLAIAEVNLRENKVKYAGVGNISGVILEGGASRSMVSHNGTVGHELHRVSEFAYPWAPGAALIMHSDGLQTRWRLDTYPGLLRRHPSIIAAVLFRDFQRGRDDATALVMRIEP